MKRRGFFKLLGVSPVALMFKPEKKCTRDKLIVDVVTANGQVIYTNDNSQKPLRIKEGNKIIVNIEQVGSHYYGDLKILVRK